MTPHEIGFMLGVKTAMADAGLVKLAFTATEAAVAGLPLAALTGAGISGLLEEEPAADRGLRVGVGTGLGAIGLPLLAAVLTRGKFKPGLGTVGLGGLGGGLATAKLTEPEEPGTIDQIRSDLADLIRGEG